MGSVRTAFLGSRNSYSCCRSWELLWEHLVVDNFGRRTSGSSTLDGCMRTGIAAEHPRCSGARTSWPVVMTTPVSTRCCGAGTIRKITRGVYTRGDGGTSPSVGDREVEARLSVVAAARRAPGLVVSHVSAALLHGLPLVDAETGTVHLTRSATSGARRTPAQVVHARPLQPADVVEVNGIRVTSVARTVLDLACSLRSDVAAVAAADWALHHGLVSPDAMAEVLTGARRQRGLGRARARLRFADGRAESPGESVLRWHCADQGLAAPELQVTAWSPAGEFLGRADLGYEECALLVEFDGLVKYNKLLKPGEDPSSVVVKEKAREDGLREHGCTVLRFVWADFRNPAALAARVQSARERAQRAVAAGLVTARLQANALSAFCGPEPLRER